MEKNYWYNFKTKEYECRNSPETYHEYIPQDTASQGLYSVKIALGATHPEAAEYVLGKWAGKEVKSNEPNEQQAAPRAA